MDPAPALSFGLGMLTAQHDPRDPRTDADIYADLVDLCVLAEEVGFDAAWLSEHHFVDDGYMSSLLPVAAAIAARTTRLQVGTGILVAPLHDPIRVAEDAATVDLLSRGRLLLGIGAGYRDEEFAGFGRARTGLGAVLDEFIATLRAAWGPDVVPGTEHRAPVRVTPKPFGPAGPPVLIGARTRPGIRRAARTAQGLVAARVNPEEFGTQVSTFADEVRAAGRGLDEVMVAVHCPVLADDEGDAWESLEAALHYSEWKYRDLAGQPYGERNGVPGVPGALRQETRDLLRAGAVVGTSEQVAVQVAEYVRAAGDVACHFIPRLYWPGMAAQQQRAAVETFGRRVIPAVRALTR